MNVTMWEHCTFDSEIFGCGKVDYSDSIIITICVVKKSGCLLILFTVLHVTLVDTVCTVSLSV
jgi:hypothetical protein